eukprot:Skav207820  [mRNA]  locus=scaffold2902:16349:23990:+ [translate_table: standard]
MKAPPAKAAGSTASTAPAPVEPSRSESSAEVPASLPELAEKAKGMLQSMKDLVVQQEALVRALTALQN